MGGDLHSYMEDTQQIEVKRLALAAGPEMQGLFGPGDEHARLLEDALHVRFVVRDGMLTISGKDESVALAQQVVGELVAMVRQEARIVKRA